MKFSVFQKFFGGLDAEGRALPVWRAWLLLRQAQETEARSTPEVSHG